MSHYPLIPGIHFFAGRCGNGKTTQMHMHLRDHLLNGGSVLNLQDPVEFVFDRSSYPSDSSYSTCQRNEGAVMGKLESSPSLIAFGEVRDASTSELALKLSQKGFTVLVEMQANSPDNAVRRFYELLPSGLIEEKDLKVLVWRVTFIQ